MNELKSNQKYFAVIISIVGLCALFMKNSALASEYTARGIETCFLSIIPSLFPIMIVSSALFRCGFQNLFGEIFGKLPRRLFGVSKKAFAAVFSGLLLGFPIGTKALIALYDDGEITQKELENAIGYCGTPSLAFLINAVGTGFFGNKSFGVFLYLFAVVSALITGMVFKKNIELPKDEKSFIPKYCSVYDAITHGVTSSASSIITLCAYVVFFYTLTGCISASAQIGDSGIAAIASLLEFSTGASFCGKIGGTKGAVLCGMCIGWSGMSVHFQTLSLLCGRIKNHSFYFLQKGFQSVICGVMVLVFTLFGGVEPPTANHVPAIALNGRVEYTAAIILFFIFASVINGRRYKKQ